MTSFGPAANRWAMAGMKIMLGGQSGDEAVAAMLEELQTRY
jgi:predicted dinucleotide-binding enzyme